MIQRTPRRPPRSTGPRNCSISLPRRNAPSANIGVRCRTNATHFSLPQLTPQGLPVRTRGHPHRPGAGVDTRPRVPQPCHIGRSATVNDGPLRSRCLAEPGTQQTRPDLRTLDDPDHQAYKADVGGGSNPPPTLTSPSA